MIAYGPVLLGLSLCAFAVTLVVWEAWLVRHDLREARRLGRVVINVSALAFPIVTWVALPGYFQVTFGGPLARIWDAVPNDLLVLFAAAMAYLVGLSWMVRIYRTSHLEPDSSSWRYRG